MPGDLPKYVYESRDRHGKIRLRFERRVGREKIREWLPDRDADPIKFYARWSALMGQTEVEKKGPRVPPTSVEAIAESYFDTLEFAELKPTTQKAYRARISKFVREYGAVTLTDGGVSKTVVIPLRSFTRQRIEEILKPSHTPGRGAANNIRRTLNDLFEHAIDRQLDAAITENPVKSIARPKLGHGAKPWSLADIAQYQARWPIGTVERLAQEIFYRTSQRLSDVVPMRDDRLERFRRPDGREAAFLPIGERHEKTDTDLVVLIRPRLLQIIDETTRIGPYLVENSRGAMRSIAGTGNWFRDACIEAGLKNRSAHGLRKARLTHRANDGATTHEIMALSGHESLQQAENYTRTAGRRILLENMEDDPDDALAPTAICP